MVGVDSGDSDFSYAQKTGGTKTSSGSHTHTTAGHSLTKYELPSHEHYMSHSHSDSFSVESGGSHTHLVSLATTNNGDLGSARIFGFGEAPVEGCFSFTNYSPFGQYPTGRQDWGYTSLVFRGGHTHSISGNSNSGGSHSHSLSGSVSTFNGYTAGVGSGGAHDHGNTGSTQVQTSTVQPYITAYFWRRTA